MADVQVRPMAEEDSEGFNLVMSLTYNNGDPIPEERKARRVAKAYVAEHEGEIKGGFSILDLTCTRGSALMRCAGVAGVAVMPYARRAGVGRSMMRWWVREARRQGYALASLYGFSERYYRMFGYEVCGKRLKITCPGGKLPNCSSPLKVRRLTPDDWRELDPCFHAFAHARSGLSLRDERLWSRVLAENRPLTIYAAGDPVESYVVVSHSVNFWSTDHLSDLAWSTPEGYRALFDILRGLAINKTALSWYEPSDSPFVAQYLDTFVTVAVDRPIMYRVCDVPSAIAALKSEPFEPFTLAVEDPLIPENEGPWRIACQQGQVTVEPADEGALKLHVTQLAQVLLGEPSLEDLLRNGLVDQPSAGTLAAAKTLFPPSPVYCPEFF